MTSTPTALLGKLAEIDRGVSWASSQETREPRPDSVPVLRIGNIQQRLDLADLLFLNGVSEKQKRNNTASRGSVMMVGSNGNHDRIGNCCRIDDDANYLFASFLIGLLPNTDEVDPGYLFHVLRSRAVQDAISASVTGTTGLANLSLTFLKGLEVFRPLPADQQAIALFFDTLDRAIEQTEALLAKQQRIKTGLMHDLLTCGLDAQGRLRHQGTHRFKETLVGRIPEEWDLVKVENAGSVKLGRQRAPIHEKGEYQRRYLRVANVFDGWIDYSDVLMMNFTPKEQLTFSLMPGDILLNEGQSLELVGRSAIFEGHPNTYCFQNTLIRFRCNETTRPIFCQSLFKYWLDLGYFQLVAKQTTSVAHLGADRFAAMTFPRPKPDEQERIGELLASAVHSIAVVSGQLSKLRRTKFGLMYDLLTGRVPVTPLLANPKTPI